MPSHPAQAIDTDAHAAAHAANEIVGVEGVMRLRDANGILHRYLRPGPHATVVMAVPTPGTVGNDFAMRWSATRNDLHHLGADETLLAHLDTAVEHLAHCGEVVLITADRRDAAYCWLTRPDVDQILRVGDVPSLIPALAEVDHRPIVVAAAIDRIGADIHVIDHAHVQSTERSDGDSERIHKSSGDGLDQARNQRHSEVIWDRNAKLVAEAIAARTNRHRATVVVVTGDRRAVDLVVDHIDRNPNLTVEAVQAGGRHEPETTTRLLAAGIEAAERSREASVGASFLRLENQLGQHGLAVDGLTRARDALATGGVKTLFVDSERWADDPELDATVKDGASSGVPVVVGPAPKLLDGVGALLYPGTARSADD